MAEKFVYEMCPIYDRECAFYQGKCVSSFCAEAWHRKRAKLIALRGGK